MTFIYDRRERILQSWVGGHFLNDIEVELRVIWVRFDI